VLRPDRLQVADIVLEPLASAEAVLAEEEKELGVALVDIGGAPPIWPSSPAGRSSTPASSRWAAIT